MKKMIIILVTAAMFAACQPNEKPHVNFDYTKCMNPILLTQIIERFSNEEHYLDLREQSIALEWCINEGAASDEHVYSICYEVKNN